MLALVPLFEYEALRQHLPDLLGEIAGRYGLIVRGWRVRPDRLDLLLVSQRRRLGHGLGWLVASISRAARPTWGETRLFGRRYRSALIESDAAWAGALASLEEADLSAQPAAALPTVAPSRAFSELCAVTHMPREDLTAHRRGVANPGSWLAVWWLSRRTTLSQREIGALIGVDQTGVAHRLRRAEQALDQDASFRTQAAALNARARRARR